MLLFSAYFWHNFGVHWLQVSDYDLTLNDQVAKNLTHSIDIYFLLIAITSFSYLFFAIDKVGGVFRKYLFDLNAL